MNTNFLLITALAVTLISCDRNDRNVNDRNVTPVPVTQDVDNTGRNVRDRDMKTMTPGDQSESEADRAVTQDVRKAIMADDSLSTNAKNVKIITRNGVIVLRGVVDNGREKEVVAQKVSAVKGVNKVDNQIEVKMNH